MISEFKVVLVFGAAVLLGGCTWLTNSPLGKVMEKVPGVGSVVSQKVTEEMFKDVADPLVRKNLVAMANAGNFRTRSTTTMGGETYTTVTEMSVDVSGGKFGYSTYQERAGQKSGEMIFLGETTYAKDYTDNVWWKETRKTPTGTSEVGETEPSFEPEDFTEGLLESAKSTYNKLGEEACGTHAPGLTCYKYEEIYPDGGNSRTFWFDTKVFLTRKEEQNMGGKAVNEYSYEGVKVAAPTPTKDVPEGESVFMLMGKQQAGQMGVDKGIPGGEVMPPNIEEYLPENFNYEDYPTEVTE